MKEGSFVWLTHAPAMARWLKRELATRAPQLRFAFARPGLTTFKLATPLPDAWALPSSFARAWGWSCGRAGSVDELLALAEGLGTTRLHVFERDIAVPIEEQDHGQRGTRARALREQILAAAAGRWPDDAIARAGERVLDVIVPHASEPDEPCLVGWHEQGVLHGREPGGVEHRRLPPEVPSRAWSKLEELLAWAGIEPRAGERAVEIGAAPGGASFALLERGLQVVGIDPGPMDVRVLAHRSGFTHLRKPFAELARDELPRRFDWLLVDVNLAPTIALRYVEQLLAHAMARPRALLFTLKLNDDAVAASLPRLHARLDELAGARGRVRVVALPSHRSEVAALVEFG